MCLFLLLAVSFFFFFKHKTAYEMRFSDWSSDVCSSDLVSAFHDPERFADRENPLADYHPAFHVIDRYPIIEDANPDAASDTDAARRAIDRAITLFTTLGWPEDTARAAIEHVCSAVARIGSRQSAYELLRRDKHARALLDLPADSWSSLLHVLLGHPHPAYRATSTGRGILLRLLVGETLPTLLDRKSTRLNSSH